MNARERCGGRLSSPVCRLLFAACRLTFGRLFDRWGAVRCGKITAQGEKKIIQGEKRSGTIRNENERGRRYERKMWTENVPRSDGNVLDAVGHDGAQGE